MSDPQQSEPCSECGLRVEIGDGSDSEETIAILGLCETCLDAQDKWGEFYDLRSAMSPVTPLTETALLNLLADIRAAAGDPEGKLMQDELVGHIADLRAKAETAPEPETASELAASLSDDIAEITASILRSMPSGISLVSRERIAQHIETSFIAGYMRAMKNQ